MGAVNNQAQLRRNIYQVYLLEVLHSCTSGNTSSIQQVFKPDQILHMLPTLSETKACTNVSLLFSGELSKQSFA
jgi:hypothetical protein